jgi:hypothetical protein
MLTKEVYPKTITVHKSSFGRIVVIDSDDGERLWIELTFEQSEFLKREL